MNRIIEMLEVTCPDCGSKAYVALGHSYMCSCMTRSKHDNTGANRSVTKTGDSTPEVEISDNSCIGSGEGRGESSCDTIQGETEHSDSGGGSIFEESGEEKK